MNVLENPIDYESLEGELHDAIRADALYKLQNDAKIRAIEQRVPTYDHFKDMVRKSLSKNQLNLFLLQSIMFCLFFK